MKAAYLTSQAGQTVLHYGERPKPRPRPGEALIRVKACALNRLDYLLLEGKFTVPLPHTSGSDVAGEIAEINGPSQLAVGQAVVINPSLPCHACNPCRAGRPCETVKILGFHTPGGFAEYLTVPLEQIFPKPDNLSFAEAAAFPLTFLTAWHMLAGRARVKPGEDVFIWGASGGLGVAGVLVAKHLGCQVIAAAGNATDAAKLRALGANSALLYTDPGLAEEVKRLTSGAGVHVVFESIGRDTWDRSLAMLRPLGRVVIAGTTSGETATMDLSELYFNQYTILGSRMGNDPEFKTVLGLVGEGKLSPVIDSTFALSDVSTAMDRLGRRQNFGKIVIEVP